MEGDQNMSEKVKIILDKNADILRLPAVALRGLVVFPEMCIRDSR